MRLLKFASYAFDLILVTAGFLAFIPDFFDTGGFLVYLSLIILSAALFQLFGLYEQRLEQKAGGIVISTVLAVVSMLVIAGIAAYLQTGNIYIQNWWKTGLFLIVTIAVSHSLFQFWQRKLHGQKQILLIEAKEQVSSLMIEKLWQSQWYRIKHILPLDKLDQLLSKLSDVDIVMIPSAVTNKNGIIKMAMSEGKEVRIVPDSTDLFIWSSRIRQMDDVMLLALRPLGLNGPQRVAKRIIDLMAAGLLLVVLSPFFLLLWLLIPLTSKGPALFKQERLGKDQVPIQVYKFRSMVADAEKYTGPVLALERDPRITKLGRFMRASRLDEIPQLLNVLAGDMSLIGPRPERQFFVTQFEADNPNYSYRFAVRPGITGLAQVMGNYVSMPEEKLRFDLMYIQKYSLLMDIKIMIQTVHTVLHKEQASGIKNGEKIDRIDKNQIWM
ncbi:sugar transferase [Paenibacillus glycanilyticus]|uniref:Sugar transferase n=1 Tax=Paenibacillus glycanilyticus TaxID=126569 RepID=A0ABQ6G5U1_9BACL|nr:sugar transferase [Paenibacillus glycanilyticus]GLX66354.1 sugar transferase [Paenibacillus glycanilyticus]